KVFSPAEHWLREPKPDEPPDELEQLVVLIEPVDPGYLVVLAVRVVVPTLGASELVPMTNHRNALGEKQRRKKIPDLPLPQLVHRRIVGRSLDPAVPTQVVVLAVAVVLEIRLVVLVVVAHQIRHREAVVRGHEIDARVRLAPAARVQIVAAGEPRREL